MDKEQIVIVRMEPSKQFSEMCGFPYFIERRFTIGELLKHKMIVEEDIEKLKHGEIQKQWRLKNDKT